MKNFMYDVLKYSNDINAIKKGKMLPRIQRRLLGKLFGRILNKIK